jgi:hypothetical protein
MPAAKKNDDGGKVGMIKMEVVVDPDDTISFEEFRQAMDLIQWVGRTIVTRNANGKMSDKFCRLCQQSRLLKTPCHHADIWRLAGINK